MHSRIVIHTQLAYQIYIFDTRNGFRVLVDLVGVVEHVGLSPLGKLPGAIQQEDLHLAKQEPLRDAVIE